MDQKKVNVSTMECQGIAAEAQGAWHVGCICLLRVESGGGGKEGGNCKTIFWLVFIFYITRK